MFGEMVPMFDLWIYNLDTTFPEKKVEAILNQHLINIYFV